MANSSRFVKPSQPAPQPAQQPAPSGPQTLRGQVASSYAQPFDPAWFDRKGSFSANTPSGYSSTYLTSELSLGGHVDVRFASGDLEKMLQSVLPRKKSDRFIKASAYSDSDDFLKGVLRIKKKFTAKGFTLNFAQTAEALAAGGDESDTKLKTQARIKDTLRTVALERNLYGVVKELINNWYTYDSMILYWRVDEEVEKEQPVNDQTVYPVKSLPRIRQIIALNPRDCEWCNDQFQDVLQWKLPIELYRRIEKAVRAPSSEERKRLMEPLVAEGIPDEWFMAVKAGKRYVDLDRRKGHNWIVRTDGPEQEGLASPSMFTIFLFLEMRRALRDGDFIAANMMKHFIQHVTMGESITSGPMAGSQNNWPTEPEIENMHNIFKECVKAARLITNHTVNIKYVFPPKEMFDTGKYDKAEAMVMHWSDMPMVLLSGGGTTNSSGFIGLQRTITSIADCREEINQVFQLFFAHPSVRESLEDAIPEDYYVGAQFDTNVLKEPRQLLEEIQFFVSNHFMGAETALAEIGRDPNKVRMEKQQDLTYKEAGLYEPLSSAPPSLVKDEGGRPPNSDTTQNQDTRRQPATLK